ncbi:MAG TPA: phage baseplate assembly protein V [Gaiellaceae bacterium]|nr:phage baseplate assembly protein V [Gaiellaceae bacterium]
MSAIVPALQAVVRDELASLHTVELGIVTQVFTNEGGSGDTNLAVNARVRGSALELQHVPVAVGRLGLSLIPREGDLAVVAFVGGDLNAPVVLGFLYDEQSRPPDGKPTEVVYVVPDDADDDARRVEVQLPSGNKLTVQDKKLTVAMGGTTLTVEGDGAITLEAGGDISLKAQGSVSIEAQSDISMKGLSATIEGQTEAKLKGVTTTIAGMTSFSSG